jgi:hypothetical protein
MTRTSTLGTTILLALLLSPLAWTQPTRPSPLIEETTVVRPGTSPNSVTLHQTPDPDFPVRCFLNGVPLTSGKQFQTNGQTLIFVGESTPTLGDTITLRYRAAAKTLSTPDLITKQRATLSQTDPEAKALHDTVALLLIRMAPTERAIASTSSNSSRGIEEHPAPQSPSIQRLTRRLSEQSQPRTRPDSSSENPVAAGASPRPTPEEPRSIRAIKALIHKTPPPPTYPQ